LIKPEPAAYTGDGEVPAIARTTTSNCCIRVLLS
jgi:hypothetical protein